MVGYRPTPMARREGRCSVWDLVRDNNGPEGRPVLDVWTRSERGALDRAIVVRAIPRDAEAETEERRIMETLVFAHNVALAAVRR